MLTPTDACAPMAAPMDFASASAFRRNFDQTWSELRARVVSTVAAWHERQRHSTRDTHNNTPRSLICPIFHGSSAPTMTVLLDIPSESSKVVSYVEHVVSTHVRIQCARRPKKFTCSPLARAPTAMPSKCPQMQLSSAFSKAQKSKCPHEHSWQTKPRRRTASSSRLS